MSDPQEPTFASLGLRESLLRTITGLGYEAPTPIQQRTIPILLAGRDLIGQAQTGTGKTAAFALPILEKIDPTQRATQALVLTPTRELAMQVAEALHSYAHGIEGLSVLPVYGGAPIVHQLKRLERGVQIVVGTPGRLIDHLDRKSLRLEKLRFIVLDEADEMLKMGFLEDVERILADAPKERQTALFSATMTPEVVRIAERHMKKAERVEIEHKAVNAPAIEQRFLNVSEGQKLDALTQILELEESDATLIFKRTKTGAAELAERLEGRGFAAVAMHGDMKQSERESVIRRLRNGTVEIVVATDVAARGLDVEQITHVVNYDVPHDVEAYVHRIGRTGRAGRSGVATLFITPRERRMMREIERYTGTPIKPMRMPSQADVVARRVQQLKDTIRKTLEEGELDLYVALVEELVGEGSNDVAEIAAAAAKLASQARPLDAQAVEVRTPAPTGVWAGASEGMGDAPSSRPRSPRAAPERHTRVDDGVPKTRMAMEVGRRDGIRPADVVGSIANEADVPGRDIGPIDIGEETTYVTIPTAFVEKVLAKVGRARFRGRDVNIRIADESEKSERARIDEPRPPRTYSKSDEPRSYAKPASRSFSKPDGASRPYSKPAGSRPYSKPEGSRPYTKPAGSRPYSKTEGSRPYVKSDRPPEKGPSESRPYQGARPYAKPVGARAYAKAGEPRPYTKPAGTRPPAKSEGARPYAKPGASRPYAKPDGPRSYGSDDKPRRATGAKKATGPRARPSTGGDRPRPSGPARGGAFSKFAGPKKGPKR